SKFRSLSECCCILFCLGFTTQQSEVIVSALVKIMHTNLDMIYKDMVTKVQQEISLQQVMSHIGGVKKDMIILEKSEFSALRSENEDEITKVRADNKLNLNQEKSRVKELHAQQDRALTQTDRKIDTEVADLKTMLESHKLDNIKYLAGSIFTCLTVALGFYRLWI
ncbi:MCUR1 regulator, partial [Anhinga anhinga]|nr:MCUR1 regulator [Anhinga anhinga]